MTWPSLHGLACLVGDSLSFRDVSYLLNSQGDKTTNIECEPNEVFSDTPKHIH